MATQTAAELAKIAQDALRVSGKGYRDGLRDEIYLARNEGGLNKMLTLAKEMRAKSLHALSTGNKDSFEANQAKWQTWDEVVAIMDTPRKQIDLPTGDKK